MSPVQGVTVRALLGGRPEAFGLTLDLLAGAGGLDRVITSPHVQKTGLALAGFHEYLRPGRVLIFGESEIRYLESLTTFLAC
jgi:serine kinase of HPr protein (carbohydrate metabolism regulator)